MLKAAGLCATILCLNVSTATAAERVVIRWEAGISGSTKAEVVKEAGAKTVSRIPELKAEVLQVDNAQEAIESLKGEAGVKYAQRDRRVRLQTLDTHWSRLWSLGGEGATHISTVQAWGLSLGSQVRVGVMDTGVDYGHEDLQSGVNPGESGAGKESNGVDDDGNGYVDDWRGWDWSEDDNLPLDPHGHGTHVSGIIAALKDNRKGVVGVAPEAKVVSLRVLDASGYGWDSDVAESMVYAGKIGLRIVNASLGGAGRSPLQAAAVKSSPDTLFVVAAGNESTNLDQEGNDFTPCEINASNVLCVGASTIHDQPAAFSNLGRQAVDMFAPGNMIFSSLPSGGYGYMSGTSMAAPHVAGAAALILARTPAMRVSDLKHRLMLTGQRLPAYSPWSRLGSRLDAFKALTENPAAPDRDSDGTSDLTDNCLDTSNSNQSDRDGDGVGDGCDQTPVADSDGDGVGDDEDNCIYGPNPGQEDNDRDGEGNLCDSTPNGPDEDQDGVLDDKDNCPQGHNPSQSDLDRDGLGDVCDSRIDDNKPYDPNTGGDTTVDPCNKGCAKIEVSKSIRKGRWKITITSRTRLKSLQASLQTLKRGRWQESRSFKKSEGTSFVLSGKLKGRMRIVIKAHTGNQSLTEKVTLR